MVGVSAGHEPYGGAKTFANCTIIVIYKNTLLIYLPCMNATQWCIGFKWWSHEICKLLAKDGKMVFAICGIHLNLIHTLTLTFGFRLGLDSFKFYLNLILTFDTSFINNKHRQTTLGFDQITARCFCSYFISIDVRYILFCSLFYKVTPKGKKTRK